MPHGFPNKPNSLIFIELRKQIRPLFMSISFFYPEDLMPESFFFFKLKINIGILLIVNTLL
jgi:hypothetical protein